MSLLDRLLKLVRRKQLDDDIDEELRFHLGEKERELVGAGRTPAEARLEARRAFGSPLSVREQTRDEWVFRWADDLWRDLRLGLRDMRLSPGFTTVAIVTLAVGIGGCAAMFAFVDQLVLVEHAYPDQGTLVVVEEIDLESPPFSSGITAEALRALQDESRLFRDVAGYNTDGFLLASNDDVRILEGVLVTPNTFELLGVPPLLGHTFRSSDGRSQPSNVAVIGELAWRRYFGGRPDIVGSPVALNGHSFAVIGVMPADFWRGRDVWVPLDEQVQQAGRLRTWARLATDGSHQTAQLELDAITRSLELDRDSTSYRRVVLRDPFARTRGEMGMLTVFVVAPIALVFLLVCVNVTHLQLARDLQRARAMAMRRALGAGPLRQVRKLLTESLLLATLGGVLGIVIASWVTQTLGASFPSTLAASAEDLQLDSRSFVFLSILAAASAVAIGIVPALRVTRLHLAAALKNGGRGKTSSGKLRGLLVSSELALCMTLLVGTGATIGLVGHLNGTNMGFDTSSLWTARLSLRGSLASDEARRDWSVSTLQRIRELPNVSAVTISSELPLRDGHQRRFERVSQGSSNMLLSPAEYRAVSPTYFEALQIPFRRGRGFREADRSGFAPIMIVNETFERQQLAGPALGQRIRVLSEDASGGADSDSTANIFEIVGVVADVYQSTDGRPAPPVASVPFQQDPTAPLSLTVRLRPGTTVSRRDLLESINAPSDDLVVLSTFDFEQAIRDTARTQQLVPLSMATFAILGLLLSGIGLFGTTARSVTQRMQELGIRQALGASAKDVLNLVVRDGVRGGLLGMGLGAMGAVVAAQVLVRSLEPQERLALGIDRLSNLELAAWSVGSALPLLIVVLLAAYLPARRAIRTDPATALRHE